MTKIYVDYRHLTTSVVGASFITILTNNNNVFLKKNDIKSKSTRNCYKSIRTKLLSQNESYLASFDPYPVAFMHSA